MFTDKDNAIIEREFERLKLACLKRCTDQQEFNLVLKAYEIAKAAHNGVRRRSGEPYIIHPIAVAQIVVLEIGLGYKSIIAALLHDVVEDTDYTVEDIENIFGAKIASLVDGLTKIRGAISSGQSSQAENFKRILLTLNDDIRVILIKLADRLHNMRTLSSMPDYKQKKILGETMYVFIPLAHRLGLYGIKSEMENLWLLYSNKADYDDIQSKISQLMEEKGCMLDNFIEPIDKELKKEGYEFQILKRTKTPYSIWYKMNKKSISFEEIYDLFAVRIIFKPQQDKIERVQCWHIYSLISGLYLAKTDRIRDWVSTPKVNGYEALHCTVMGPQGNWIEVQIRTTRMNDIAERGVAAHWSYKADSDGSIEKDMEHLLDRIKSALENPTPNPAEFLDQFHVDVLSPEIQVFTPKGETRVLTKGSTALDFAYLVHTEIGNKAIAAKVNFKLQPLSYVLKNGDQVEIITTESGSPKKEWLDFVRTQKAQNIIKEALKSQYNSELTKGEEIFKNRLKEIGSPIENFNKEEMTQVLNFYRVTSKEDLFLGIAHNAIKLDELQKALKKSSNRYKNYFNFTFLLPNLGTEKNINLKIEKELTSDDVKSRDDKSEDTINGKAGLNKIDRKSDYVLSEDQKNQTLTYVIAQCCRPIPGDRVIGFLDRDGNVVVHNSNCEEATKLASKMGDRIVKVKWSNHFRTSFLTRISIVGIDRVGVLNEISQCITIILNINIRKILIEAHDGIFKGYIDIYVLNSSDVEVLIKNIYKISGVKDVKRVNINDY